jgi:26S proteasome regulatory subunit N13
MNEPNPEEDEVSLNTTLSADEKLGLLMSLSLDQKRELLSKVLRSPQLHQSLGSLTVALRDGGLPTVSSALGVEVANEGFVRGSAMPLGGGEAVKAFLEGVRQSVKKELDEKEDGGEDGDKMVE